MSKTGRNEPCPCGSGKKYKKCCLARSTGPGTLITPKEDAALPGPGPVTPAMQAATDEMMAKEGYTPDASRRLREAAIAKKRQERDKKLRAMGLLGLAQVSRTRTRGHKE